LLSVVRLEGYLPVAQKNFGRSKLSIVEAEEATASLEAGGTAMLTLQSSQPGAEDEEWEKSKEGMKMRRAKGASHIGQ
jgi:hypothetical protein